MLVCSQTRCEAKASPRAGSLIVSSPTINVTSIISVRLMQESGNHEIPSARAERKIEAANSVDGVGPGGGRSQRAKRSHRGRRGAPAGGDWLRWRGSTNMNVNTMVTSTITAPRWSRPKLAASIAVSHRCSIARSEYEAEITGARSRSTFKNPNEGSVNSVDAATVQTDESRYLLSPFISIGLSTLVH